MFLHNEYHLIRRAGKVPVDKGWPDNPIPAQVYNDHRANGGEFGLVCGSRGIYVLDIDVDKSTGQPTDKTIDTLLGLDLPETLKVTTPSGGTHYFFESHADNLPTRKIRIAEGIDWLGKGGYVALYEPLSQYDPELINGLPESVLALLQAAERVPVMDLEIKEGNRNDSLFKLACALFGEGLSYEAVKTSIMAENDLANPPLPFKDVMTILGSARKYERAPTEIPVLDGIGETLGQIAALKLPPIESVCGPITTAGVTILSGAAGIGKSLFSLHVAAHVAAGKPLGGRDGWDVPKARRVLYIDAEMASQYVQGRIGGVPQTDTLKIIHLDYMARKNISINFADPVWREWLLSDAVMGEFDVFIFDTVSALVWPTDDAPSTADHYWLQLEPMHQKMRAAGKCVLWLDNLNKAGQQYGTVAKLNKADCALIAGKWEYKSDPNAAGFKIEPGGKIRGLPKDLNVAWEYRTLGWLASDP